MPKINRMICLEYKIWEDAKKLNLNVSGVCEDALAAKVQELQPTDDKTDFKEHQEKYVDAWDSQGIVKAQKQRGEVEKWARETEDKCIHENRELWNQAYRILRDKNELPIDSVERVRKKEAMFEELKRLEKEKTGRDNENDNECKN